MLPVEGSYETGLFRRLSNHVFGRTQFPKYIGYEGSCFFPKFSKFNVDLGNADKNSEKVFCF